MLYIIMLVAISVWMILLILTKKLSWHSIVAGYAIGVFFADIFEVSLNLLLNLYKFPTHLSTNPIYENEIGIIFADTLILPFTIIIFLHYTKKDHPWRATLPFAILFIILEYFFVKLGYIKYIHWSLAYSALLYIASIRFFAYLAPYIKDYNPPIPYPVLLLSFSHTIIMWVGATFALPIFKMYQFRPNVFKDIMADCRFTDLLSGDVLAVICAILVPKIPNRLKLLFFTITAFIGVAFALYAYYGGWLIYHRWNHLLMMLRYFVPIYLIMLYDRWESAYRIHKLT
ncbi:hypothetical protein HNQ80_004498 [Anaerosolibacter carboniphilus]|uniref:Uncharacterized protein n=1 Tax=Anaerosolibacter carboniphilus TaxID=1417629 RepID=A0A841KXH7_9FIRM|nr:hypothetical protein [Anaerosolibacter carboniphilus]MBB6218334.1 hypothetical protein [Anaerosolibacter carboniphilus]